MPRDHFLANAYPPHPSARTLRLQAGEVLEINSLTARSIRRRALWGNVLALLMLISGAGAVVLRIWSVGS